MQHLLLLHGAIGSMDQFADLKKILAEDYHVHCINFTGHGGLSLPKEDFSIKMFAADVLNYMEQTGVEAMNIFGYSMGGYVGIYLAKMVPEKINRLATLATKFHWDEAIAEKETGMLNAQKIEEKLPAFAQSLIERHQQQNWKQVLKKTADMLIEMGKNNPLKSPDYTSIGIPVKLMLGDRDKMVTLDETLQVYRALPNARLCIIPDTAHPIEAVDITRLTYEIRDFMK
ncbi:MAG TPA: alpha/beta fold hydrolase [Ferruginibacter sp.]|nr:alpha/beta fold hydrolase [Ferruginibacter sp.]